MLLAQRCTLCESATQNSLALCSGCKADLPWIDSGCQTCGLPLPDSAEQFQCGECLTGSSAFTLAVIPLLYQNPVKRIITSFKHRRGLAHGHLLAQLLIAEIRDHYLDTELPEVIIPVPLHWQRLLWRGYNQSVELGKQLGKELGIPCQTHLLKRIRRTPSQQGLSRQQRLHNLEDAFQVKQKVPYRRIALLDDVVTTGSTASEISRLLLNNGAKEIHLWAIARTPAAT